MTTKETWILINAAFNAWSDDHVQSMGAALAYYTMFSIAPLLLIAIAGLAFGEEAARGEIAGQFQTLIGEAGGIGYPGAGGECEPADKRLHRNPDRRGSFTDWGHDRVR